MEFQPKSELKSVLTPEQKDYWAFLLERKKELEQKAIEKGYDKLTSQELLEMKEFVLAYKDFVKNKGIKSGYWESSLDYNFHNFTDLKNFQIIEDVEKQRSFDGKDVERLKIKELNGEDLTPEEWRFIYEIDRRLYYHDMSYSGSVMKDYKSKEKLGKIFGVGSDRIAKSAKEVKPGIVAAYITGGYTVPIKEKISFEELYELAKIHLLNASLKDVSGAKKQRLEYWRGSICDRNDNDFSVYQNLKVIGKNLNLQNDRNKGKKQSFITKNLLFVGDSLTLRNFEQIDLMNLLAVSGCLSVGRSNFFQAEKLSVIGGSFFVDDVEKINLPSLTCLGVSFGGKVKEVNMEKLKTASKNLDFRYAEKVNVPNLEYLDGVIHLKGSVDEVDKSKIILPDWVWASDKIRWK